MPGTCIDHGSCHFQETPTSTNGLSIPSASHTEVVLIVLRHLHQSPDGIVKSEGANSHLPYDLNVQLSSQLLRCCQLLYVEGEKVLYTENTLNVSCGFRPDEDEEEHDLVHCYMFDTATQVPRHCPDIPQGPFDLLSWGSMSEEGQWPIAWLQDSAILDRYKYGAALRFTKVEVSLGIWNTDKVFIVCRILQDLVRGKKVKVVAPWFDVDVLTSLQENSYAFSGWHCSTITFDDFDGDNTDAVADLIRQPRPIFDGLPMAQEIHRFLTVNPGISFREEGLAQHVADGDIASLWSAIWLHDSSSFKEHKNRILERALVSEGQYWTEEAETFKLVKGLRFAAADRRRRTNKTNHQADETRKHELEEGLEQQLERIAGKRANSYSMIGCIVGP